jgi:hypothetical protein
MKRTLKRESKVLEIAGIEGMASSIGGGDFRASALVRPGRNWLCCLCGAVGAGSRTRPVPGPRSGWICGGREWLREGGCPRTGADLIDRGRWIAGD